MKLTRAIETTGCRFPSENPASSNKRLLMNIVVAANLAGACLALGLGRIVGLPRDVIALIIYSASIFGAVILTFICRKTFYLLRDHSVDGCLAFLSLSLAFSCFISQVNGVRSDGEAMWRQLLMGLLPMALYLSGRLSAATAPMERGLMMGVTTLGTAAVASTGLDFLGFTRHEAYGLRYFGFLGDGVGWLASFVGIVFLAERRWFGFGATLMALALTGSRGASLVFLAATLLVTVSGRYHISKKLGAFAFVFCLAGLSILLLGTEQFENLFSRLMSTDLIENDRLWTTQLSLNVFEQSPIFGSGYNSQQYFYGTVSPELQVWRRGWSTPTSTAMQILADGGVVGIAAYLSFLLMASRLCWRFLRWGDSSSEGKTLSGLAAWTLCYLWLNQSAAWLLPSSYLSPIVFCSLGLLAGATERRARVSYLAARLQVPLAKSVPS